MTTVHIKAVTLGVTLASLAGFSTLTLRAADEAEVKYQPFTLSAGVGTLGIGAEARWRFSDHFGVRGGLNYFTWSKDAMDIEGVNYDADFQLLNAPLSLDIYLWDDSPFRISIGALINQNEVEGFSPSTGAGTFVTLGGVSVDSGAVGDISMTMEQETFSPFVSIGGDIPLNRSKSLSLGFEVGVAYTGSPEVTMSATSGATFSPLLAAEAQEVESWAEDFKFYPIIKVSLDFAF
jgi:hypothetical protein